MALTERQRKAREGKLTASAVACLMKGDEERIFALWQELTGDPDFVPPDFSNNWHVQLGECTEALNLRWFGKKHGAVSQVGTVMQHAEFAWAACTLDGWSEDHACPIECKHLIGFTPTREAAVKYYPQMQWQMFITDAEQCAFSAIQGGRPPDVIFIQRDEGFITEMLARAQDFMKHVHDLTPPVVREAIAVKDQAPPDVEYDMADSGQPEKTRQMWEATAAIWLLRKPHAKIFEDASSVLKKLCPADGVRMFGNGIEVTRNKAGALTIKEIKNDKANDEGIVRRRDRAARRKGQSAGDGDSF